jgi:exodeoxyribonuclease V alpha subunit
MEDNGSQIEIEGQIDRITYSNEETGYTVAKLKVRGYHDPVIAVGYIMAPAPGEILLVNGNWTNHPRFGRQFKIKDHRIKVPATAHGIKKYLGSGLIRGIGPVMASKIVKRFGEKTLEVIENRTDDLTIIDGIGCDDLSSVPWRRFRFCRKDLQAIRSWFHICVKSKSLQVSL